MYEEHRGMVRGVLFKLCGGRELDDIVQETFIRLWKGLPSFRGQASLKTWVYSVTVRAGIDHLRHAGRRRLHPVFTPPAEAAENEHLYRDLVRRGLAGLSAEHRTVLVLYVYEGLSVAEIADVTSSKEGTVKSRLHYARSAVADFLKQQGVDV